MPVCGLVFILIIYLLENVLENIFNEKNVFRVLAVCLTIILITPIIFKMEPEEEFLDKLDKVSDLAVQDACTGSNPRKIDPSQMAQLLKATYYGTEVDF